MYFFFWRKKKSKKDLDKFTSFFFFFFGQQMKKNLNASFECHFIFFEWWLFLIWILNAIVSILQVIAFLNLKIFQIIFWSLIFENGHLIHWNRWWNFHQWNLLVILLIFITSINSLMISLVYRKKLDRWRCDE